MRSMHHLQETERQIERLEMIFEQIGQEAGTRQVQRDGRLDRRR